MQKSRRVSLTPTLRDLNWHLFCCHDWNSFKKKHTKTPPQLLTPPIQFAYVELHPPQMSYIASLDFWNSSAFLTFSGVFWATQEARAAGTHRIRVQGTQETDAFSFDWCRHRATFAPWGFVDRGALHSQPISSFEYCPKAGAEGGGGDCREMCLQWPHNRKQENASHWFCLQRYFHTTVFDGGCSHCSWWLLFLRLWMQQTRHLVTLLTVFFLPCLPRTLGLPHSLPHTPCGVWKPPRDQLHRAAERAGSPPARANTTRPH